MPNGMHQVRLPHSYAPIDKERVVGARGSCRNSLGCGMSKLVARANDESVEGQSRVQVACRRSKDYLRRGHVLKSPFFGDRVSICSVAIRGNPVAYGVDRKVKLSNRSGDLLG